jgi:cyclopropane fatty-acyl-phospholipid synthase-like methyltransferase
MPREFHDLAERQLNHESSNRTAWGNFGDWGEATTYPAACAALADQIGTRMALGEPSRVIDVGFGCGDQLLRWLKHYRVGDLAGLNLSQSQTNLAQRRLIEAGHPQVAAKLSIGSAADLLTWAATLGSPAPNAIIALDCAYHFAPRSQFLTDAAALLAPGGQLGVTDLVLADDIRSRPKRLMLNLMTRLARLPRVNLITADTYRAQWRQAGFAEPTYTDISDRVMEPFGNWLRHYKLHFPTAVANRKGWVKYDTTAAFMRWAYRERLLRYVVCVGRKP